MESGHFYEFGPFRLDPIKRVLLRQGEEVVLPPKAFDVLLALVTNRGEPLTRDELMKLVWPDTFVEEGNLTQAIFLLRKALDDNPQEPRYIVTMPRRGYRFAAGVIESGEEKVGEPQGQRIGSSRRFWVAGGALALAGVLAVSAWMVTRREEIPRPQPAANSIVVLPFANLSADRENEYFSDGLTEELINALTRVEGLRVVARSTAFQFKGKSLDVRGIGEQLGVATVLEGSVRKQTDRVRITARISSGTDGRQIWSQNYDRDLKDVFAVQEEIAQAIVGTFRKNYGPAIASPLVRPSTDSVAAYNLYLQGRYHRSKVVPMERAIAFFQQAIEKDPNYAAAYAALADCYAIMGRTFQIAPSAAYTKATAALNRALVINDSLADTHTVQGYLNLYFKWDWDGARRELERAIVLDPADARTHHYYAKYFIALGRFPESLAEIRRALELDPAEPLWISNLVWHYLCARDFDQAIAAGDRSLQIAPNDQSTLVWLRWTYEQMGLLEKAADIWERVLTHKIELRRALEVGGPKGYWRALLNWQLTQKNISGYHTAIVYARLGEPEKAFEWLERAYRERNTWLVDLNADPAFDTIRADPRFVALVKKVGLPTPSPQPSGKS